MANEVSEKKLSPLELYHKSETEEQKQARVKKSALTQRKHNSEKQAFRKAFDGALRRKWRYRNEKGEIVEGNGLEAIAMNVIAQAIDPEGKNVVPSAVFIRDTMGEKPTDKIEADTSIEIIMSEAMRKLAK
jgi:hypothetical protein